MIHPSFSLVKLGPAKTSLPKLQASRLLTGMMLSADSLLEVLEVFQDTFLETTYDQLQKV